MFSFRVFSRSLRLHRDCSYVFKRLLSTSPLQSRERESESKKANWPTKLITIPPTSSVLPTVFTVSPCALAIWETMMLCIPFPSVSFSFIRFDAVAGSLPPAYHQQQWLRKEIKLKKFTWRLYARCLGKKRKSQRVETAVEILLVSLAYNFALISFILLPPPSLPFQVYWWYVSKDLCWPDLCGIESFIFGGLTIM